MNEEIKDNDLFGMMQEAGYDQSTTLGKLLRNNTLKEKVEIVNILTEMENEISIESYVDRKTKHYEDFCKRIKLFEYGFFAALNEPEKTVREILYDLEGGNLLEHFKYLELTQEQKIIKGIEYIIVGGNIVKVIDFLQRQKGETLYSYIKNLKTVTEDNNVNNDPVLKHIFSLSGKWGGRKIMTEEEYKRLVEYTNATLTNGKLPAKVKPISKGYSLLPKLFYQHTFYRLWLENKTSEFNQPQKLWIEFVTKVFADFYRDTEHDLSKSFARYNGNYDADKARITHN